MSKHSKHSDVNETWWKFFQTLPGFPDDRKEELHRQFMGGYRSVIEPQEKAAAEREAARKAKEAEAA